MATGVVIGPSGHREHWNPTARRSDEAHNSSGSREVRLTMGPFIHHRSYSDVPDRIDRPRLPPISNLIEGAGRSDTSYHPHHHITPVQPHLQSDPIHNRLPPTSPDSSSWSPGSSVRTSYMQDRHQQYRSQSQSGPESPYYGLGHYHRASISSIQQPRADVRLDVAHVSPEQTQGSRSPSLRTTNKNVVREDFIPELGLCYVYDDGSVCQKFINGDTVNPKWGTTKAGKPRKRLGQACNTCREKKIKCDPSSPKCTQCQKFGRECRFEAPSRLVQRSPRMRSSGSPTASHMSDDIERTRRPSAALTETSSHSESGTISSRAACTAEENLSPVTNDSNFMSDAPGPSKKARLTQAETDCLPIHRMHKPSQQSQLDYALDIDPFTVNKKLTEQYLNAYFANINSSFFSLVPERAFLVWAEHAEVKSQVSILVLYCMLALGCSFSKSSDKALHEGIFASIAQEGVKQSFGYFSVQLIQARVIFALYEFQNGRDERAWDMCGAALRTACTMKLNTEEGIAQQLRETGMVYGLDESRLAECMRRTFWAAYTMDNLGVSCFCVTSSLSKADCFLRLPCTQRAYEAGTIPQTPVFVGEVESLKLTERSEGSNVGTLAYMMQIASLCCDVRVLAFRSNHHGNSNRHKQHATYRNDIENQLRIWNDNYLAHINRKFSQRSSIQGEYPFSFGGLHLMYHYACMQLHRQIPHSQLSRAQISEHAQLAYHHAEKTLAIAEHVMSRKSQAICNHTFALENPMSGYAVHYAIDILTAAGINSKVLEHQSPVLDLIINSVHLLDKLADIWTSAKMQSKQVSERVKLVMNSANAGITKGKVGFCMEEPMALSLKKEEDLVYGVDRMQYLNSFGWADQIRSPSDLNVVSGKGKRGLYSIWKD